MMRRFALLIPVLTASEHGTSQEAIDAALAPTNQDARVTAVCTLAADSLARGHEPIALATVACTAVPQFSCLKTCVPATTACFDTCDAAAGAQANCPEPQGVGLHFAPILAARARLALMAASATKLTTATDTITGIKGPCIPYARDRVRDANAHVAASQKAVDALIVAAGP